MQSKSDARREPSGRPRPREVVAAAAADRFDGFAGGEQTPHAARFERPHGGWRASIETGVAAAYQEPDPLARHRALARLRWDIASELAGGNPFSADAVLAWAVKLLVNADLAAADSEKGLAKFDAAASAPSGAGAAR